MNIFESAILKTLSYADVFNFPLNEEEVRRWLISNFRFPISNVRVELNNLLKKKKIGFHNGYYCLLPKAEQIDRKQRVKTSCKKRLIARQIAKKLQLIPTISLIGISGTVAIGNAQENDDIDLYIVCKKGTVWTTRFFSVLISEAFGVRRRPHDRKWQDKICLNMFVDENCVGIDENEKDLFSAHEVLQMQPVFNRDRSYSKFLFENKWVKNYLRNAWENKIKNQKSKIKNEKKKSNSYLLGCMDISFCNLIAVFLEPVLRRFQLWYMKDKRTKEIVSKSILRFHPQDARVAVLREYKKRTQRVKIKN